MRDVLLGALTYVLAIAALVGVMVLCSWLWGPPSADRIRSFDFLGGGGALLLLVAAVLIAGVIVYSAVTS